MELLTTILLIIGILIFLFIGYFIGKKLTEEKNWGAEKKAMIAEWQSKLEKTNSDNKLQMEKLVGENKLALQKVEKETDTKLSDLNKQWEVKYLKDFAELKEMFKLAEKAMRKDAVSRSRSSLLGKVWEQVSPYLPKFPYAPNDMKFLGSPIDFIVFDGLGERKVKKVVFLEVKANKSALSPVEKTLKKAIEDKKVYWKEFRTDLKQHEKEVDDSKSSSAEIKELYGIIDEKLTGAKASSKSFAVALKSKSPTSLKTKTVSFECPECDEEFDVDLAPDEDINDLTVDCPNCKEEINLSEDYLVDDDSEEDYTFKCPECKKKFGVSFDDLDADDLEEGVELECPHCGVESEYDNDDIIS